MTLQGFCVSLEFFYSVSVNKGFIDLFIISKKCLKLHDLVPSTTDVMNNELLFYGKIGLR